MRDQECVDLLRLILPQLGMQWSGFRKVRRQVCKRLQRRIRELQLSGVPAYVEYLRGHREEMAVLDRCCRITISRFYRDRAVFHALEHEVLPRLAREALNRQVKTLSLWSAGCGAGEEPYTLSILWKETTDPALSRVGLQLLATDIEPLMLQRARLACYVPSSLKELPEHWQQTAFQATAGRYCLRPEYREPVEFRYQDIRASMPHGPFHGVLCRNLAFTYYDHRLQLEIARHLADVLLPGGVLVLGTHESLPEGCTGFASWSRGSAIYRRTCGSRLMAPNGEAPR